MTIRIRVVARRYGFSSHEDGCGGVEVSVICGIWQVGGKSGGRVMEMR